MNTTKVIGSVRVSTEDQTLGDSLEHQEASIRAYCAQHGLELVRIEVDRGLSASTLAREGLGRALDAVRAGEAVGVVVTKLDRLTRSVRDLESLKEQGMGKTWRLFAMEPAIDTSTLAGEMFLQMLTVFAEFERKTTAQRTRELLAYAKSQGQPLGNVPYGWKRVKVARVDGRRVGERGRLVPDLEAQARLAWIRTAEAEGMSRSAIARTLNEAGATGPQAGAWTATSVRRALARAA